MSERSDSWAEEEAVNVTPFRDVARRLVDALGGPNVAAIAGVSSLSSVWAWIAGADPRSEERQLRARLALRLVLILRGRLETPEIRAWFRSANRAFELRSPIEYLREATPSAAVARALIAAAEAAVKLGK